MNPLKAHRCFWWRRGTVKLHLNSLCFLIIILYLFVIVKEKDWRHLAADSGQALPRRTPAAGQGKWGGKGRGADAPLKHLTNRSEVPDGIYSATKAAFWRDSGQSFLPA